LEPPEKVHQHSPIILPNNYFLASCCLPFVGRKPKDLILCNSCSDVGAVTTIPSWKIREVSKGSFSDFDIMRNEGSQNNS